MLVARGGQQVEHQKPRQDLGLKFHRCEAWCVISWNYQPASPEKLQWDLQIKMNQQMPYLWGTHFTSSLIFSAKYAHKNAIISFKSIPLHSNSALVRFPRLFIHCPFPRGFLFLSLSAFVKTLSGWVVPPRGMYKWLWCSALVAFHSDYQPELFKHSLFPSWHYSTTGTESKNEVSVLQLSHHKPAKVSFQTWGQNYWIDF